VSTTITRLRPGRTELALHLLRDGDGPALLLLHGLGERTPPSVPAHLAAWPGAIHGLDFLGHGDSAVPRGGGYTAEAMMADADQALAAIGPATVLGRGLGAYVALLVSGARADLVRGAVLADGPGLVGGGIRPSSPYVERLEPGPSTADGATPDPYALAELSRDVRPPDYAVEYVRMAMHSSGLDQPISVAAVVRPEWLAAVVAEYGVVELSVELALRRYAD
jgi:pimeloyl-ACP methyl ester carboxylesterase